MIEEHCRCPGCGTCDSYDDKKKLQYTVDLALIAMASGESGHAEGLLLSVASKEAREEYEEIVG